MAGLPDAAFLFPRESVQVRPSAQARKPPGVRNGEITLKAPSLVLEASLSVWKLKLCLEFGTFRRCFGLAVIWYRRYSSHVTDGIEQCYRWCRAMMLSSVSNLPSDGTRAMFPTISNHATDGIKKRCSPGYWGHATDGIEPCYMPMVPTAGTDVRGKYSDRRGSYPERLPSVHF